MLALLLEGRDAIAVWRGLLGPGDPSVGRRSHPESIRAVYGTNKLANAAHGADSLAAAAREIAFVFGEGAVQPGGGCEEGTPSAKRNVLLAGEADRADYSATPQIRDNEMLL